MDDQICFQKARQRFIPALEGADRDLVFEERSCLGSGYPAKTVLSLGTQKPFCCRCAHREQLVPALLAEVEMSMPLECFDKSGQKGHQPFGTDLVGGAPCLIESLLNLRSIVNGARRRAFRRDSTG